MCYQIPNRKRLKTSTLILPYDPGKETERVKKKETVRENEKEVVKVHEYIDGLIKEGRTAAIEANNVITLEDVVYILSTTEDLSARLAKCFYVGIAKGLSIAQARQKKALQ